MSKIICVSGDSYTQEYFQKPEDRWSNKIGATHNIAMGGAGNDRIFNATLKFLNEITPDVLIVGWSTTARASLYHKNGGRIIVAPHRCFNESTTEDHEDIQKFYYSNLHNDYVSFYNTLNYMVFLQDYCKAKNIKLRYFRSVMYEKLDYKSLKDVSYHAYYNDSTPEIARQGVEQHIKLLQETIRKLDKDIWIKEFWYSMHDHIVKEHNYVPPGTYGKALPVGAVAGWAEVVKRSIM